MRHPVVDELEERRVVRRLAWLAEAVVPLPDDELDEIVRRVTSAAQATRAASRFRARSSRRFPSAAAAVAAALSIAVGIGHSERRYDDSQRRGAVPERLFSFPEGSALELLLSRAGEEWPA